MNSKISKKLAANLKKALKQGRTFEIGALRMLIAAIKNKEIEKKKKEKGLSDQEIIPIIQSEIKERKEAIGLYKKGGRDELAEKEEKERKFLEKYLPEQLSEEDLTKIVKETIEKLGATGPQDLGRVMGTIMKKVKGKAEGSKVKKIVEEELVTV